MKEQQQHQQKQQQQPEVKPTPSSTPAQIQIQPVPENIVELLIPLLPHLTPDQLNALTMTELRRLLESLNSTHHLVNILPASFLKVEAFVPEIIVADDIWQQQQSQNSENSSDRPPSLGSSGEDKFSSSSGSVQQSPAPSNMSPGDMVVDSSNWPRITDQGSSSEEDTRKKAKCGSHNGITNGIHNNEVDISVICCIIS